MASVTSLMKRGVSHLQLHSNVPGLVFETGLGFGASYGLAQLYVRKHDQFYGRNAFKLAGAVGKLGALAITMMAPRHSLVAGLLDTVGQAGVNGLGVEMGLSHARAAMGLKTAVLSKGAALPAGASETMMGALGAAAAGRGLSFDQIQEMASMH